MISKVYRLTLTPLLGFTRDTILTSRIGRFYFRDLGYFLTFEREGGRCRFVLFRYRFWTPPFKLLTQDPTSDGSYHPLDDLYVVTRLYHHIGDEILVTFFQQGFTLVFRGRTLYQTAGNTTTLFYSGGPLSRGTGKREFWSSVHVGVDNFPLQQLGTNSRRSHPFTPYSQTWDRPHGCPIYTLLWIQHRPLFQLHQPPLLHREYDTTSLHQGRLLRTSLLYPHQRYPIQDHK